MQLAERQADRKFFIGGINKHTNSAKAFVRRAQNWKWDDDDKARKEMNDRAARIVATISDGAGIRDDDLAVFGRVNAALLVFSASVAPLQKARADTEKVMVQLARQLPVYPWVVSVKGFGEKALGVIIGETGDLSNYPKDCKVWKRLGLAPFTSTDGVTKACSTWRRFGGLTKEEWTGDDGPGYSPRRRAEVYAVLSEPLFRTQTVKQGPYRAIYDKRRAHTAVTHPDWSLMQSHMDGLRIMTKQAVSDLWSEWRRASDALAGRPNTPVPAAPQFKDAA